jgi:hypothetical protein
VPNAGALQRTGPLFSSCRLTCGLSFPYPLARPAFQASPALRRVQAIWKVRKEVGTYQTLEPDRFAHLPCHPLTTMVDGQFPSKQDSWQMRGTDGRPGG